MSVNKSEALVALSDISENEPQEAFIQIEVKAVKSAGSVIKIGETTLVVPNDDLVEAFISTEAFTEIVKNGG